LIKLSQLLLITFFGRKSMSFLSFCHPGFA